jgi:hypothetical protein
MSQIRTTLLGLWDDLRARRLLPVAALLVAALIAAPLVLSKKSETPDTPPAPTATPNQNQQEQGPKELAQVRLDDRVAQGTGSSLSAFDASNPFAPPEKVIAAARQQAQGGAPAPTDGTAPTDTGAGGGGTDEGGDTGGGDDTGGGETKTTEFTYVIDVTVWANGRKREVKGMEKLDVLPGQVNPLLIFMGVTSGGGNAVFLVDSTLTASGEGACKPSDSDCATVEIGPGSEEQFTNDAGDVYKLRIDQIRKVKVEDEAASEAASKDDGKTANASVEPRRPVRRFELPPLADVVLESVTAVDDSTGDENRR